MILFLVEIGFQLFLWQVFPFITLWQCHDRFNMDWGRKDREYWLWNAEISMKLWYWLVSDSTKIGKIYIQRGVEPTQNTLSNTMLAQERATWDITIDFNSIMKPHYDNNLTFHWNLKLFQNPCWFLLWNWFLVVWESQISSDCVQWCCVFTQPAFVLV